jgi:hypothetical protein
MSRALELIEQLRRTHDWCEDCWYSCPKSSEGCCNDSKPKDICTCGADAHNAKLAALRAEVLKLEEQVRAPQE